jgi:hypothetical protein
MIEPETKVEQLSLEEYIKLDNMCDLTLEKIKNRKKKKKEKEKIDDR